jgi:hypothetical protein
MMTLQERKADCQTRGEALLKEQQELQQQLVLCREKLLRLDGEYVLLEQLIAADVPKAEA